MYSATTDLKIAKLFASYKHPVVASYCIKQLILVRPLKTFDSHISNQFA